ncbi:DNA polymerase subunit gamma-2 isoform X2 [Stigmatopora argus]
MFSQFVRNVNPSSAFGWSSRVGHQTRRCCDSSTDLDQGRILLQLFVDRHFISPGHANVELFKRGVFCSYGPLGTELRENVLSQWWRSMSGSKEQVFGIKTSISSNVRPDADGGRWGHPRLVQPEDVQNKMELEPSEEQNVHMFLQRSPKLRSNLIQGALEQFIPLFDLVNKKLPFGIAETGRCFQLSEDGSRCPEEVTQASLIWFCSPRTSSQWLDHWVRQRLRWWRKFAHAPSDFSSSDLPQDELEGPVSRGVKILYKFPWGQEPLEILSNRGDGELLQMYKGVRSKLLSRDGRKSIPHVLSITGNIDRGLLAFLFNSLQLHKREAAKQKLQQRKVLKLHPLLAPVKVALSIGRGATTELRQVCEGLLRELKEGKISAWSGYLETSPSPLEQLNSKYDEMGILFNVVVSENTLESGLVQIYFSGRQHVNNLYQFCYQTIAYTLPEQ